ncbi:hypothetical protein ACGH2B_21045 [Streptomyces sp. BBFR2]|uniref:hypothetical protein n=1 Tax=Streptomyces sp. BBFR2 TaxID=3372854 RepID=UPI0037DA7468
MEQQPTPSRKDSAPEDRVTGHDPARGPDGPDGVDVEEAEAALVAHYPRLVRLAYLVLPHGGGRGHRVRAAHAVAQRALPRRRTAADVLPLPGQRGAPEADGPGYAVLRVQVVRQALAVAGGRWRRPGPLPQVWGVRLAPRPGGAAELSLDRELAELSAAGRAAYVLRSLERLAPEEVLRTLTAAGVRDPEVAVAEAEEVTAPGAVRGRSLLESPEFDACALQARPTDLIRRRQHGRALLVAGVAVVVCGALLGLPGQGWGPQGAAAPPYAENAAARAAMDPARLTVSSPTAWKSAAREDFAAWPARGDRTGDKALLRRALAVWARPGPQVKVAAAPGTATGPAAGPAQLLFAGAVDHAAVVLLHDGQRLVRYAEAADGSTDAGAALDFARTDGAQDASAAALVVSRTARNVRYLTAPWASSVRLVDLLKPGAPGERLAVDAQGVSAPAPSPGPSGGCDSWPALRTDGALLTDLGETTPARLTYGTPQAPGAVDGPEGRTAWARTACQLPALRGLGVRSVNAWPFARQALPGGAGTASWLCARAETWRGPGSRTLAVFQGPAPAGQPYATGAVAAAAEGGTACGPRAPRVLAGALWKSGDGTWWLLAAGSRDVTSIAATGGVRGGAPGRLLTLRVPAGSHARLTGRLRDGGRIDGLG